MTPSAINVRMQSRVLEVTFEDVTYSLPFELLRVFSPSAEVRGHGEGQEILQTGMRDVSITALQPVGNYAVQPHFTDGHTTGIFSWSYLHWLGEQQTSLWNNYLKRLNDAGYPGETGRDVPMVATPPTGTGSCNGSNQG